MKVALVHDWLVTPGGAEKVLEALCEAFPDAPIFTLVYQRDRFSGSAIGRHSVVPSFLDRLPGVTRYYRSLIGIMPYAVEQLDLRSFDVVISSSHAVAKGVLTHPNQLHISYFNSLMRYIWDHYHHYMDGMSSLERWLAGPWFHYLRMWDVVSTARPDRIVANSSHMAQKIRKIYRRRSSVIHPPVETGMFQHAATASKDDFFLTMGRLVPFKRFDIVIEAFNRLGLKLLVVGSGPELPRLRKMAKANIEFVGSVPHEQIPGIVSRARSLVYAGEEDFGIVLVESQAAGTSVIAFGQGGAREIVIPLTRTQRVGATGILYDEQTPDALAEAVRQFIRYEGNFDPRVLQKNAARFEKARFIAEFLGFVTKAFHGGDGVENEPNKLVMDV